MSTQFITLLNNLLYAIPAIVRIIIHYKELVDSGRLQPEDKATARELLEQLRLKPWEDIKP